VVKCLQATFPKEFLPHSKKWNKRTGNTLRILLSRMFSNISPTSLPLKGGTPARNSKNITPGTEMRNSILPKISISYLKPNNQRQVHVRNQAKFLVPTNKIMSLGIHCSSCCIPSNQEFRHSSCVFPCFGCRCKGCRCHLCQL
jgi:hypothetical protein